MPSDKIVLCKPHLSRQAGTHNKGKRLSYLYPRTSSTRQIFQALFIVRPDGLAAIHVESAVMPIHHVLDDDISDFAFGFEHFEHFMAKQIFKLNGIGRWAYHEGGIVVKAAIGGQNMQVGMKILKTLAYSQKTSLKSLKS